MQKEFQLRVQNSCNKVLSKRFLVRELAFGDICLFGGGRCTAENCITMWVPAECCNDFANIAGMFDRGWIDRPLGDRRGGYLLSQADQELETLQMIRAFAMT